MNMTNVIPPITHPLGLGCVQNCQPPLDRILIDDTHAVMLESDWNRLNEYSMSIPTGVYAGKMWKAIFRDGSVLRWYSDSQKEGCCDINQRDALIV